jgi:hypothetical protein
MRLPATARSRAAIAIACVVIIAAAALVAVPELRPQASPGHSPTTAVSRGPNSTTVGPVGPAGPVVASIEPTATVARSFGFPVTFDGPQISWTAIDLERFGTGVLAVGAAELGGTAVVVANTAEDPATATSSPVILVSENGSNWTQVSTGGAGFANVKLDRLLPMPGGLLLVGESLTSDPPGCGGASGCNPVMPTFMWRSTDGLEWERLPDTAVAPFTRVVITAMTVGATGVSALGTWQPATGTAFQNRAFHSADGISWSSTPFPSQGWFLLPSMVATSTGFAAVDGQTGADGSATVWLSPDGLTWTKSGTQASKFCSGHLAAGSGGMYTHATRGCFSADGKTWQEVADTPDPGIGGPPTWTTSNGSKILLLSGRDAFWSSDGRTWQLGRSTPSLPTFDGWPGGGAWLLSSRVLVGVPGELWVGSIGAGASGG